MTKILIHTSTRGDRIKNPLKVAGFELVSLPRWDINKAKKSLLLLKKAFTENPDVILVDCGGLMGFYAYFLSKISRSKFVIRLRADIWTIQKEKIAYSTGIKKVYEQIIEVLTNFSLRRASLILSVSSYLKKRVVEEIPNVASRVCIVELPINYEKFIPLKKESNSLTILSVTNFSYKAKTEGLIAVLPAIDNILSSYDNVVYKVAGRGKFSEIFLDAVEKLKNKIVFLGFVKNIEDLYASSDIFLYYSFLDGLPNVVLEAQSCKLPVVANDFDPIREAIENEITGFLVKNVTQTEKKLELLIEDPVLRKKMGEKGRKNVIQNYNLQAIAEKYRSCLDKIR